MIALAAPALVASSPPRLRYLATAFFAHVGVRMWRTIRR
jgi:hypothetical protein